MNTEAAGSDRATPGRSFMWLVLVPTVCAIAPWLLVGTLPHDPETNEVSTYGLLVEACIPMIGVVSVAAYGLRTSRLRALWPLLPFVAAATCYLASMLVIVVNYDDAGVLEGTTWWYGEAMFAALLCGLIQPFLAAIGGGFCLDVRDRVA